MASSNEEIRQLFEGRFGPGGRIHVVRAPGRVNLIGEHTDYNEGFVLPMAIEPEVRIVCRAREDGLVRLATTAFEDQPVVQFSLQERIERGEPVWTNYSRGVAAELIQAGVPLAGMDALIANTLPVGGGLSSSAAVEISTALALLTVSGQEMDLMRLALLCQQAEHEYALVPCGIMDQMIVANGQQGHAMLLDCRDLSRRFIAIKAADLRIVIANSMVRHELSGGEYAERRRQCEEGVRFFQQKRRKVKALRDVTLEQVQAAAGEMEDVIFRRCRHVVSENDRTTAFASLLEEEKYEQAGRLMVQSHASLRDDYEVSCEELDFLAGEAMTVKGVYGARMTGGGFGGCIVALVQPRQVEHLAGHLGRVYQDRYDRTPEVYVTTATAGAGVIE
jgi:galactokinase